ncbi:MAG: hypothetical protein Q9N67_03765 [Ghiorsea sp.]|nr:hypothetical protein [Ghiorsea sp.]
MKLLFLLKFNRLRMLPAALALLGFMWASIDLHQHDDGFHNLTQCTVCALEESTTQGFYLFLIPPVVVHPSEWDSKPWQIKRLCAQYRTATSIRAPPYLTVYS